MVLLEITCVLSVLITPIVTISAEIGPDCIKKAEQVCERLAIEPYFDVDMVVGKPWRIYYAWNMKLEDKCMDMTFKNATPLIVNRIFHDMHEYLETQPYWDAATLLVSMGRAKHEMLLFADQGAAGSFLGVPNVIRDGNISPTRSAVPLMKFQLKLIYGGRYLLMGDCHIGITTLSARSKPTPYRAEVGGIAQQFNFGDGFHACTADKNPNELTKMK